MHRHAMKEGRFTVTDNKLYIISAVLFLLSATIEEISLYRIMFGDLEESLFRIVVIYCGIFLSYAVIGISLFMREGWKITVSGLFMYAAFRFVYMVRCIFSDSDTDDKVRFILFFMIGASAAAIYLCSKIGDRDIRKAMSYLWFVPGVLYIIEHMVFIHFNEINNLLKYIVLNSYAVTLALFIFLFAATRSRNAGVTVAPTPAIPAQPTPAIPAQPTPVIPAQSAPAPLPGNPVSTSGNGEGVEEASIGTVIQPLPVENSTDHVNLTKQF